MTPSHHLQDRYAHINTCLTKSNAREYVKCLVKCLGNSKHSMMIAVNIIFITAKFVIHTNKYGSNTYDTQCLHVFCAFSMLIHASCAVCNQPILRTALWFETFPAQSFLHFVLSHMLGLRVRTLPNQSCFLSLNLPKEVSLNLSYINSYLGVWLSEDPDRSTDLISIFSGTFWFDEAHSSYWQRMDLRGL